MSHDLLVVIVNGAFFGLIYGLFAVGLVVVYRGSRVINFAHGEIGMVGTFVFDELWREHGWALGFAILAGIALSAAIGATMDVVAIRPLRDQPRINSLVATFALASAILFFAARRWGLRPRFTAPIIDGHGIDVLDLTIRPIQLLMLGCSIALLAALVLVYERTSYGLKLKATALDPFAAGQVGVNVNNASMATWAAGGAIAAVCGILIASQVSFSVNFMTPLMLRSLGVALIGGLTNPVGVFGAGLGLGILEGVIQYETNVAGLMDVILGGFILVLLLVRPAGLVRAEY